MPIISPHLRFIEKFLAHFNSVFSTKHQRTIFREFIYGMFSDYKRLSLAALAGNTHTNYQRLQYFFSEANWNTKELKRYPDKNTAKSKNNQSKYQRRTGY